MRWINTIFQNSIFQQGTTAPVTPVLPCPVAQRVDNVRLGSTAQRDPTSPLHVTQDITARLWDWVPPQGTVQQVSVRGGTPQPGGANTESTYKLDNTIVVMYINVLILFDVNFWKLNI